MAVILEIACQGKVHRTPIAGDPPDYGDVVFSIRTACRYSDPDSYVAKYADEDGDFCTLVESTFADFVDTARKDDVLKLSVFPIVRSATGCLRASSTAGGKAPIRLVPQQTSVWEDDPRDLDQLIQEFDDLCVDVAPPPQRSRAKKRKGNILPEAAEKKAEEEEEADDCSKDLMKAEEVAGLDSVMQNAQGGRSSKKKRESKKKRNKTKTDELEQEAALECLEEEREKKKTEEEDEEEQKDKEEMAEEEEEKQEKEDLEQELEKGQELEKMGDADDHREHTADQKLQNGLRREGDPAEEAAVFWPSTPEATPPASPRCENSWVANNHTTPCNDMLCDERIMVAPAHGYDGFSHAVTSSIDVRKVTLVPMPVWLLVPVVMDQ